MPEESEINPNEINFFAETAFRSQRKRFGIKLDDRRRHMYVIGKTGMGKSTMLENMVIQDINNGHGLAYLDPHGDTAEKLLDYIPPQRINDVVYFNPGDLEHPIAFNILESVEFEHKHLVASGLMAVFTKIWANLWSARMEYILNNTILALLEVPGNTLLGIMRMLADKEFRKKIVSRLRDPIVKSFWTDEYANWNERFRTEAIQPIQNKVGQFLSSSIIRNIVGQPKSTIDLRDLMDNRKILIMNLAKGRIGEDASALLGAMMITKLQLAAMSRVDVPEEQRKDFMLYVDEFQNYSTESFANILSEARKYRLDLVMAHQYVAQLSDEVRDAVFGNVGTTLSFRVGAEDAEALEKEFAPYIEAVDIVNLPKYKIYLKLMIDGVASRPFSAQTFPPLQEGNHYPQNRAKVIGVSRERYSKPAAEVEEKIVRWLDPSSVARDAAEGAVLDEEEEAYAHSPASGAKGKTEETPAKEPNAVCDNCEKPTHIAFEPDDKRNVFCKDCLKLFKNGEIDPAALPKRNLKKPPKAAENGSTGQASQPIVAPSVTEIPKINPDKVANEPTAQPAAEAPIAKPEISLTDVVQQAPQTFKQQKTVNPNQVKPGEVIKFSNN